MSDKRIHRDRHVWARTSTSAKNKIKREVGKKYIVYSSKRLGPTRRGGLKLFRVGYVRRKER